ncbi:MAG: ATP-binding cassette domain-containing protein, partial [Clostridia bacterium]
IVKDGKLNICYMPQNSVGFAVSVKNNVEIAGKGLDRKLTKESAYRLLSDLGLWQLRRKNAAKLSGGETQRLSLARSLVVPHDVLLLDEPTAAMDVGSACVAEGIIKDYAKKHNCTLIFSSHSFGQVERLADEVLFMHEGEILEIGEPSQLLHAPNTAEARAFVDFLKFDK